MRLLWTLVKVVLALALVVPLAIIALALGLGILGALLGLAVLAVKLAIIGLIVVGAFRLLRGLIRPKSRRPVKIAKPLPPVDPYYEAAVRELDRELGGARP